MYVGFMDLETADDRVNKEALCQVLRLYDLGGKLLNKIKRYICLQSRLCQNKIGINSGVRQGDIMSP